MSKGLKLSKWVLTNRPKIPWVTQKITAQFVCLSQRVWDFWKKKSLWMSVVRTWAAFQAENARCCAVQHLRHHNLSYCHVSSTPDSEARKVSKVTYVQLNKYQTDIYISSWIKPSNDECLSVDFWLFTHFWLFLHVGNTKLFCTSRLEIKTKTILCSCAANLFQSWSIFRNQQMISCQIISKLYIVLFDGIWANLYSYIDMYFCENLAFRIYNVLSCSCSINLLKYVHNW